MPIKYYGKKVVVIAGIGDIEWGPASHQHGAEIDHIMIKQGEPGKVGRILPDLIAEDDWAVKIALPNKESWTSFYYILKRYAFEKWGEIPEEPNLEELK